MIAARLPVAVACSATFGVDDARDIWAAVWSGGALRRHDAERALLAAVLEIST